MSLIVDLLDWLQGLPRPALVGAAGLLTLAECTIGVGFVVPGESALLVAATTATTPTRFLVLWAVVSVCAIAGDAIGYLIGRRYGPRLRDTRLIRRYGEAAWDRATGLIARRGVWAVFIARFFPVIRTLTPAASGVSGLRFSRFLSASVAGAVCWSALHIALGSALGQAAVRVERYLSTGAALLLGAVVLVAVVVLVRRRRARRTAVGASRDRS
jgi:membrane protein DedA with SNARE-associated domain